MMRPGKLSHDGVFTGYASLSKRLFLRHFHTSGTWIAFYNLADSTTPSAVGMTAREAVEHLRADIGTRHRTAWKNQ